VPSKLTRVTQDGQSGFPSLSPDGKLLAYASFRSGAPNGEIYVQQLTGQGMVRLTNHPAMDVDPAFSADGSKVYFASAREPVGIYEISALGGDARLVVRNGFGPAASPDGKWLAYMSGSDVWVRALTSGESRALTSNNGVRFARIVWSPDSSRIAVIGGFPNHKLTIANIGGTKVETLPFVENLARRTMWDHQSTNLVAWLPGNDLLFTAPSGNTSNVWRMPMQDLAEASPQAVTLGPLGDSVMASAQGGKLAFTLATNVTQLWNLPSDVDAGRVVAPLRQLTHGRVPAYHQDVSPDGRLLAWCSRKAGPQGIWLTDLVSGKERLLVQDDGERSAYSHLKFSPDGSAIAAWFSAGGAGARTEIRLVDVATGQWRSVTKETAVRIRGWSPDGQLLVAWRRGQPDNVVVVEIATGTVTEILSHPSSSVEQPRLSPAGNWVAFNKGTSLFVAPFRGKKVVPEADWIEVAQRSYSAFWSPNGRNLYYIAEDAEGVGSLGLMRQPFDPNSGRPIDRPIPFQSLAGHLVPGPVVNQIVAARDGVVIGLFDAASDIWVMDLPR
jgi:Tol biopolymer transport system component